MERAEKQEEEVEKETEEKEKEPQVEVEKEVQAKEKEARARMERSMLLAISSTLMAMAAPMATDVGFAMTSRSDKLKPGNRRLDHHQGHRHRIHRRRDEDAAEELERNIPQLDSRKAVAGKVGRGAEEAVDVPLLQDLKMLQTLPLPEVKQPPRLLPPRTRRFAHLNAPTHEPISGGVVLIRRGLALMATKSARMVVI